MITTAKLALHTLGVGALVATLVLASAGFSTSASAEPSDRTPLIEKRSLEDRNDDVLLADFSPEPGSSKEPRSPGLSAGANADAAPLGPADKKAGPGCSVQCITSGVALARGPGAELRVRTDTPARIFILVWNDNYARIIDSGNGSEVTEFSAHFDDLEAGEKYNAIAEAVDAQGYKSEASGHFDTLSRHVKISFNSAQVSHHAYSGSSFRKLVWAEGDFIDNLAFVGLELQGSMLYWNDDVVTLENVGRYLDFAVQLDEKNPAVDDFCQIGNLTEPSVFEMDCGTFAYATFAPGMNDLDDRPAGATSWTEHTLERTLQHPDEAYGLPPGWGQPLTFYVDVELHVTYE